MKLPALSAVYQRYETLSQIARDRFSGSLAGKLLLRSRLDADGLADMMAASIGGACSLCLEPGADSLRGALRAGFCDFVVGTLDEALRILKNELRRGRAVSAGLTGDPDSAMTEMIDRGLQPDLVALPPGELLRTFLDRGASALPERPLSDPGIRFLEWTVATDAARSLPQIAAIAARILDASRPDTPWRRRWLESAPRQLGRAYATRQCLPMTEAEFSAFIAAARAQFPGIHVTGEGAEPG